MVDLNRLKNSKSYYVDGISFFVEDLVSVLFLLLSEEKGLGANVINKKPLSPLGLSGQGRAWKKREKKMKPLLKSGLLQTNVKMLFKYGRTKVINMWDFLIYVHRYLTNKTKVVFEMYIRIFYLPIVFHDSRCKLSIFCSSKYCTCSSWMLHFIFFFCILLLRK